MALLWPSPESSAVRQGRRSRLDVDRIVAAGVRLADAEGLSAVSMRRVAADVGVPAMTLYGYLPGKAELVDLMRDAVFGELYPDEHPPTVGTWRARVEAVARANREFYGRHPWVLATGRPAPGPNLMRKYEIELRAVDGLGLSEVQMDLLLTLIDGFVRGAVDGTGEKVAAGAFSSRVFDPDRFPTAARVGPVAHEVLQGAGGRDRSFEFGLERLLDGIGVLILNPSR
jgi:AcrR family transcriptional regulator